MLNRLKLFWINIALVIILLAGAAIAFSFFQANASTAQEKTRLEARLKATALELSEGDKENETHLESLRQTLEQAELALAESPLASEAEKGPNLKGLRQSLELAELALSASHLPYQADAIAATDEILQYAQKNFITITRWNSSYSSTSLKGGQYPSINHSLIIRSEANNLVKFIQALNSASVAPTMSSMDITEVGGGKDTWQTRLEVVIYYRD